MEVNVWKRLESILPKGTRLVAEVTFLNTVQGTSTVQRRGGASFIARGVSVPVGQNALIIDGNIVSKAPDLPQYDVVV